MLPNIALDGVLRSWIFMFFLGLIHVQVGWKDSLENCWAVLRSSLQRDERD